MDSSRLVRWSLYMPLASIVALVVAACGGGEATATPRPAPTNTPQPTPTAAPAATTQATATARPAATATPAPTPTIPPAPTPTPGVRPKTGGTYRTSTGGDPRQLVPLTFNLGVDIVRLEAVMNGLLQWDAYKVGRKELVPSLAESWTVTPDGLGYTFKLRQGVKWHDGNPFTMKDVLFSMDLARKGHMKAQFAKIDKVEAVDATTLRITEKQLDPDFLVKFAQPHMMMMPSHLTAEQFKSNPVGTGPFKWAAFASNSSTKLARNDQYFKAPYPYLDGATVFTITDDALSLNAYRAGELDRSDNSKNYLAAADAKDRVSKAVVGTQYRMMAGGSVTMVLNNVPPWNDQRVRKAFHLSVDRNLLNDTVHLGGGYVWAGVWLPPALGGVTGLSEDEMKQMPGYRQPKDADYAESKRLLKEAGLDGSQIELNFLTSRYPDAPGVVAQSLRQGGFTGKLNVRVPDQATFTEDINRGNFAIAYHAFGPLVDLPEVHVPDVFMLGGLINLGKWDNPEINRLYAQQAGMLDFAARIKIVHDIYRIGLDWATAPSVINSIRPIALAPYVRGEPTGAALFFDEWNRFEQVWLDK